MSSKLSSQESRAATSGCKDRGCRVGLSERRLGAGAAAKRSHAAERGSALYWKLIIIYIKYQGGVNELRCGDLFLASMNEFAVGESRTGSQEGTMDSTIDPAAARFPRCIVWNPLPVMSWLAPFVGHVGICRENGVILDFAGPYFVNVDNFAFGATARYVQLSMQQCSFSSNLNSETHALNFNDAESGGLSWDNEIGSIMQQFQHIAYNLFTCNCHSFVASCLNKLVYRGSANWNVIGVIFLIVLEGRWVNKSAIAKSFAPFVVVMCLGLYMVGWPFFIGWALFNLLLIGWFTVGTYCLRGLIKC